MIKFKGQLCDGEVHINAHDFIEQQIKTRYEKDNALLRRLANNPIIDKEYRDAVWRAIERGDDALNWRKAALKMREMVREAAGRSKC